MCKASNQNVALNQPDFIIEASDPPMLIDFVENVDQVTTVECKLICLAGLLVRRSDVNIVIRKITFLWTSRLCKWKGKVITAILRVRF